MAVFKKGDRVVDQITGRTGKVVKKVKWDRTYYNVMLDGSSIIRTREQRDLKEAP